MGDRISLLNAGHDRQSFSCGIHLLDEYLQKFAGQDLKNKVSACFILSADDVQIRGYYTLATGSIPRKLVPEVLVKKLPRYKDLPVTLLGRLAIDQRFQGKGLGEFLLMDAMKRSLDASGSIGSYALMVDPIDDRVIRFYARYGFIRLANSVRMFLPMVTIQQAFR